MFPFIKIFLLILQGIPQTFLNPLFWILIFFIFGYYKRSAEMQQRMFGRVVVNPSEMVVLSTLFGTLGGVIGSLIVVMLGVCVSEAGLIYIWPLALLLMLVHPRYMCFSYAGGIISLFSLVFGFPKIDVAGLMALVAVLHLIESLLIYFTGYINAVPVFLKEKEHGLIGGFSLQEFWPVPIILLVILLSHQIPAESMVQMPDWWPLIQPPQSVLNAQEAIFMMFPVVAVLGYSDIALTRNPKSRCRASAINLLFFSTILMVLAVLASYYKAFAFLAALFSPIAHELLIIFGKNFERRKAPLFVAPSEGERVLDVMKDSPAQKLGLKPGDIILQVNGRDISNLSVLNEIMSEFPTFVWVKIKTPDGKIKEAQMQAYPSGINSLGVILVPHTDEVPYMVMEEIGAFHFLKQLIKKS